MSIDELVQRGREAAATPLPPPEQRRALRMRAGLSLSAIGRALGVDPSVIFSWERGGTPRDLDLRIQYAKLLEGLEGA